MEVTKELGGESYVLSAGRERHMTQLTTAMKRQRAKPGRFTNLTVDYAKKIGFTGKVLIIPKPKAPYKPTVYNYIKQAFFPIKICI